MTSMQACKADVPAVEFEIVSDMLKRGLLFLPVLVFAGLIGWGLDGVTSVLFAFALIAANYLLSAAALSWSARISLGLLMGVSLFGFLIRGAVLVVALMAVRDQSWVALTPLGITLVLSHLGLLLWEMRFVSASAAFPGLQPQRKTQYS